MNAINLKLTEVQSHIASIALTHCIAITVYFVTKKVLKTALSLSMLLIDKVKNKIMNLGNSLGNSHSDPDIVAHNVFMGLGHALIYLHFYQVSKNVLDQVFARLMCNLQATCYLNDIWL